MKIKTGREISEKTPYRFVELDPEINISHTKMSKSMVLLLLVF